LLDIHHDRPPAVGGVFQMLRDRIVVLLPSIQRSPAKEAHRIIRVGLIGLVVETRMRQLRHTSQPIAVGQGAPGQQDTSAGEGLRCGQVMGFAAFALDVLRFAGGRATSKLARRAAKVSIPPLIASDRCLREERGSRIRDPDAVQPRRKRPQAACQGEWGLYARSGSVYSSGNDCLGSRARGARSRDWALTGSGLLGVAGLGTARRAQLAVRQSARRAACDRITKRFRCFLLPIALQISCPVLRPRKKWSEVPSPMPFSLPLSCSLRCALRSFT